MSDMLMKNNGKESSTKQKIHIRVRYFFIKVRIENKDFSLKYLPKGEIYADFFTNTLQVATFCQLQAMIQVIPERTLDLYMSCSRAMAKLTSRMCVG